MNEASIYLIFGILVVVFLIVVVIRYNMAKHDTYTKNYILKVMDMENFVKQVNWIMNYKGTLDFDDLTFLQYIREDKIISENNCTFKIINNKSASITVSAKFFNLSIYDTEDNEERHYTFKRNEISKDYSIHINTDHDHVQDLVCIKGIINRMNTIYKKYVKVIV